MILLLACATPPAAAPLPAAQVVHLPTADGVTLEADWYANATAAPAALLLHMIPPSNDRTTWPVPFIEALRADGYAVLALDRRGAGGSGGVAKDAYLGPAGVLDARAAVDFLRAHGTGKLVIVGASNGTTTALDYAGTAAAAGYPAPDALVFMSPGPYTTANHALAALPAMPLLFVYPAGEAEWNDTQRATAPPTWTFHPYAGTAHGTHLFADTPTVSDDVRAWLRRSM